MHETRPNESYPLRKNLLHSVKLYAKFGENRTNGSGVIQVSANVNMAADGHIGL